MKLCLQGDIVQTKITFQMPINKLTVQFLLVVLK